MEKNFEFIWGANWYIEDGKAWFVDELKNILWCLDLETNQCEYIVEVPCSSSSTFRLNPKCIKNEMSIFCMPDISNDIWVYDLEMLNFQQIRVKNINNVRLLISDFWKDKNKIFAVSRGLKEIIEINIDKKIIDNYYTIGDSAKGELTRSIKVDSLIYCLFDASNQIYQFNIETKEIEVYTIPEVIGGLYTICFDGNKFWLCGYNKELYVWDKKSNFVEVLTNFPEQFGIYDFVGDRENILDCKMTMYETPTFAGSVLIGEDVWFIPCQTNEIIYVDKNTYQMNVLDIAGEDETKESLLMNHVRAKYYTEYVLDNRYIGLFSFKNNCMIQIDAVKKKAERKTCLFSKGCLQKTIFEFKQFYESDIVDKIIFKQFLSTVYDNGKRDGDCANKNNQRLQSKVSIGEKIYIQME